MRRLRTDISLCLELIPSLHVAKDLGWEEVQQKQRAVSLEDSEEEKGPRGEGVRWVFGRLCQGLTDHRKFELYFQNKEKQHQAKEMSKPKHTGMSITNQNQQVFIWKVNFFND